MQVRDTILTVLSDMHTGSSTALFPAGGFQPKGKEGNLVKPNDKQKAIHPIFTRLAGEVAKARKGKRLIIVLLGDLIDGFHHGSMQESLFREQDQADANILLVRDFMKRTGYHKGDELYCIKGTEVHVKEIEEGIAQELGAAKSENGTHVSNVLQLNINGRLHMFYHHGKSRGSGPNEGNELRNHLRNWRYERDCEGLPRIDFSWSGHTHGHSYNAHFLREGEKIHAFHAVICPSFQAKTRYALEKVPTATNSVGGTWIHLGVDGSIGLPQFVVCHTSDS